MIKDAWNFLLNLIVMGMLFVVVLVLQISVTEFEMKVYMRPSISPGGRLQDSMNEDLLLPVKDMKVIT